MSETARVEIAENALDLLHRPGPKIHITYNASTAVAHLEGKDFVTMWGLLGLAVIEGGDGYIPDSIKSNAEMKNYLLRWFTSDELILIWNHAHQIDNYFAKTYTSGNVRVRAIVRNILRNKGMFKPSSEIEFLQSLSEEERVQWKTG